MATSFSDSNTGSRAAGPGWASALGVVAIVLGVFLTAYQANEWMKHPVMVGNMPANGQMPEADCPEEELEEEGLSLAECEYMVAHVKGIALSTPDWFPGVMTWLAFAGTVLAFASVLVGGALVNYNPLASGAAVLVFGGLVLVDAGFFAASLNAGPILREVYLWQYMLWLLIHMLMVVGVIAGRHSEADV